MKRIIYLLIVLMLLCGGICSGTAEGTLTEVQCTEQDFTISIPSGKSAYWEENVGFRVSVETPGYVPYVVVFRRPSKLNDPVNFLNNVYREYMEERYDNNVGTNPCRTYEIGDKTLYGATYHYEANGNRLCLTLMIEVREDGDVEYHAKYLEGKADETMEVLETAVLTYRPGIGEQTEDEKGKILLPITVTDAEIDTENGTYYAQISDTDRILNGGYFTATLYAVDLYSSEEVDALRPGDKARVAGQLYTVSAIKRYDEETIELFPEEEIDGYIVFKKTGDVYYALVDDLVPMSSLTEYRVMMPLPNDFAFGWIGVDDEAEVYDSDAFVSLMTGKLDELIPVLSQYDTMIGFRDGLLMTILHTDYPMTPAE